MSKKDYLKANLRKRSLSGSGQKYKSAAAIKKAKKASPAGETTKKTVAAAKDTAKKAVTTTKDTAAKKTTTAKETTAKKTTTTKKTTVAKDTAAKETTAKKTTTTKKTTAAKETTAKKTSAAKDATAKKTETTAADTAAKKETEAKKEKELLEPAFLTRKSDLAPAKNTSSHNYNWKLIVPALAVVICLAFFVIGSQAGLLQTFLTPESRRTVKETTTPETTTTAPETTTEKVTKPTTTEETTTEYIPSTYVINVNLGYNRVTVYSRGEKLNDGYDPKDPKDDEYDLTPVIAFTCSPGLDGSTPTGTFYLQDRNGWCLMIHDVYTQYATRIVDDVMFHSIPYLSQDPGDLATYDYNILGSDASSACIRLNVRDASWIFNNCAYETEVNIFYDYTYPGPIDPEPIYQIPEDMDPLSRWDPTDVYSAGNPWLTYEAYLSYQDVQLPCYSSPDALIAALGPTDEYGHNLSGYFHTDGGYDLQTPGTYTTTGHIDIANCNFTFPITITVTEEWADNTDGYYDENGNFIYYETYDDSGDDYSDDGTGDDGTGGDGTGEDAGADGDYSEYDAGGYYGEDAYFDANSDW